jgi:hypothetical protein
MARWKVRNSIYEDKRRLSVDKVKNKNLKWRNKIEKKSFKESFKRR